MVEPTPNTPLEEPQGQSRQNTESTSKPIASSPDTSVVVEYIWIKQPKVIIVDGVNYPITRWNIDVIFEYDKSGDKTVLAKLKDFSLVL